MHACACVHMCMCACACARAFACVKQHVCARAGGHVRAHVLTSGVTAQLALATIPSAVAAHVRIVASLRESAERRLSRYNDYVQACAHSRNPHSKKCAQVLPHGDGDRTKAAVRLLREGGCTSTEACFRSFQVRVRACPSACLSACLCACVCAYACLPVCLHKDLRALTCWHARSRTRAHTCWRTHAPRSGRSSST